MFNQQTLDILLVNVVPLIGALAVVLYHILLGLLPKTKAEQLSKTLDLVDSAAHGVVRSVEQTMSGALGSDKKAAAASSIEAILAVAGLKVAPELVSSSIESAVHSMNELSVSVAKARVIAASVEQASPVK